MGHDELTKRAPSSPGRKAHTRRIPTIVAFGTRLCRLRYGSKETNHSRTCVSTVARETWPATQSAPGGLLGSRYSGLTLWPLALLSNTSFSEHTLHASTGYCASKWDGRACLRARVLSAAPLFALLGLCSRTLPSHQEKSMNWGVSQVECTRGSPRANARSLVSVLQPDEDLTGAKWF